MTHTITKMIKATGGGKEGLVSLHVWMQELMMARTEEASALFGRRVDSHLVVMDMKHLSYWPHKSAFDSFRKIVEIDTKYYPETLSEAIMINCPWIFPKIWSLVKPWIDPNTAAKFHFVGKHFQEFLFERVAPDQVPREFGGTAEIELVQIRKDAGAAAAFVARMKRAAGRDVGSALMENSGGGDDGGEGEEDS